MMLFAATAMLATAFTTTSCSKDDDDTIGTYTLYVSVETGNMPEDLAQQMKSSLTRETPIVCTLSEAKSQFSKAVSESYAGLSDAIKGLKGDGYTGISITVSLKDSKGTVIDKRVWD